ncbi:peptide/nickel transport system substrate-binding protein [Stella humosa]|uniref:Peptide/nickel transport system substrate-binding protein n=1 Tax=Stella humosa TaxID=94 RepID=A0A3N1LYH6_9PROT|nr:ABC transporter substrate-binding protein [Stella humosa]ROQ00274.1 peptide/nickel transport system substrate-binding protein [Stella humosa]BBK30488.1 ABC transporter substrate-binding protein [Stella humosa]
MRPYFVPAVLGLALAVAFSPAPAAAKDRVVVGMQAEPPVLDPTINAAAAIDSIVSGNVFESLTLIDDRGGVTPGLAESWTISADGRVFTFRLPEKATFHNGRALTSEDVRLTFARAMAGDSINPSKKVFQPIEAVEAPDARTVVIRLKQPTSIFLFSMASGDASITATETVDQNRIRPVGSGPFRFKEWVKGDRVVLERYPDYRHVGRIKMREAVFKFIPDPSAQVAALLAGDVDAFPLIGAPESLGRFQRDQRFKVVIGTTEGEVILALNNSRKPFDDVRVRRAINHAIDRKALIDGAMFGYGTPIGAHFPPHHPAYVDLTGRYPHDIAKAKALLAEAGLPNGFETTVKPPPFPYARRGAEVLAAQLGQAGIRVKIEPIEWAQWLDIVYKQRNYDMTIVAHTSPYDMDNYVRGPNYYYGYQNKDLDALMKRIDVEVDTPKLYDLYGQAQRMISEDAVHGFLFQLAKTGVYASGLRGYGQNEPIVQTELWQWSWAN